MFKDLANRKFGSLSFEISVRSSIRRNGLTAAELNDLTYKAFWGVDLIRAFKDSVLPFPGGPVDHQQMHTKGMFEDYRGGGCLVSR